MRISEQIASPQKFHQVSGSGWDALGIGSSALGAGAGVAAATGGIGLPLMLGIEAGSGLLNLLGGIFGGGPDPEEIFKMRMDLARKATERYFSDQEARIRKMAMRDMSVARQRGGREAAALGLTTTASSFTAPLEGQVNRTLSQQLDSLLAQKSASLANLQAEGLNFPIIQKPNALQYGGQLLGSLSQVLQKKNALDQGAFNANDYIDALYNRYMSAGMGTGMGQNQTMSQINRLASLGDSLPYNPSPGTGVPSRPVNWASQYFTFGNAGNQYGDLLYRGRP